MKHGSNERNRIMPRKSDRGFTLIELVMVIVIIGVLSAIIVPNFVDYVSKSAASSTKANLSIMRTAIQAFRGDNLGTYPADDLDNLVTGGYIPEIPEDGVLELNTVVNTANGLGGWHWNTTTKLLLPNLSGNDAYGDAFNAY